MLMHPATLLSIMLSMAIPSDTHSAPHTFTTFPQQHPIATTFICGVTVYALCYSWVHVTSKNKPIRVNLVTTTTSSTPKGNYLFAHGIAETHEQAYWYAKGTSSLPHIIDGQLFTYDYPDATKQLWRVNFTQTSLGQDNEIMGLKNAYDKTITTLTSSDSLN